MLSLEEVCKRIQPADAEVMHRVWKIWDNFAADFKRGKDNDR